jgi:arylsulfatase A-like enzyme
MTAVRPNVILIVFDTARADVFEPYGAPVGASPCVADLARRGTSFQNAIATGCWTVPSHASMFTGNLPMSMFVDGRRGTPPDVQATIKTVSERMLPNVLRANGYDTAGISTNLWVSKHTGFDIGFDRFKYLGGKRVKQGHKRGWKSRLIWDLEAVRANLDDGARAVERTLEGWLGSRGEAPFFWFVNLLECHSPYLPPKPYNDLGPLKRLRAAEEAREYLTFQAFWLSGLGLLDVPEEALERMRHLYARSIVALDDWLARLLANLDRHGLLDETIVIVTSDHGENFAECGGMRGHGFSLDNRLVRVPFVVAGPGVSDAPPVFSCADLPALIASWAGIEEHPWEPYRRRDVAVSQYQAQGRIGDQKVDENIARWNLDDEAIARLTCDMATATNGRLKLRRRGGIESLYDLETDPLEAAPQIPSGSEPGLDALRAALDDAEAARAVSQPDVVAQESSGEDAELEAQMKLLGYL